VIITLNLASRERVDEAIETARNQDTTPERVLLDNRYIDSWSLLGDLAILLRTVPAILRKSRS